MFVTEAGLYEVIELSDAFCSGTSFTGSADVNLYDLPTSEITTPSANLCDIDYITVELTGTAPWSLNYTIDGANSITIDDISTSPYSLAISQTGLYEITALSDANCIGTSFTGSADISASLLPSSVIKTLDVKLCQGGNANIEIEFTGTAPWNFNYTIDGANETIISNVNSSPYLLNVSSAGTYEITSLSDASTTGTCFVGTAIVTEVNLPSSNITTGVASICSGESISIDLTGTAPWTYTYELNGANPIIVDNAFILWLLY